MLSRIQDGQSTRSSLRAVFLRFSGVGVRLGVGLGVVGLGSLAMVGTALADPPRYRIIVVEPPDGVTEIQSFPVLEMGINNWGEAVGTLQVNGAFHPFVWLPAANSNYDMDAGTHSLPLDPERTSHTPREINVNGFVVGRANVGEIGTSAYMWNLQAGTEGVIYLFTLNHKDEATDINDADPPVIVGGAFVPPDNFTYGYKKIVYTSPPDILDVLLPTHIGSRATSISDAGFVAGTSVGDYPSVSPCGIAQDYFKSVTWEVSISSPDNLATLGTPLGEALTTPLDVNNASPSMIVGKGQDPNDLMLPCRERALFWENASVEPISLPFLTVNGQPAADTMQAHAVADPLANGTNLVVGLSGGLEAAVLWRRINDVWEAIDLNTVNVCGGDEWANLSHAMDINDCGWIIGQGELIDGSVRAFILVPMDSCPGDIGGEELLYPDGKVDVEDLLALINRWGTNDCIADIAPAAGNGTINVDDLLTLINNWGNCSCFPSQPVRESFASVRSSRGLTQAHWDDYINVMTTGTTANRRNYNCWMQRYLSECLTCPGCPGRDPFVH